MQFWSGTPFMKTTEIVAVARMFDEAGYDGLICSDHLIYPPICGQTDRPAP